MLEGTAEVYEGRDCSFVACVIADCGDCKVGFVAKLLGETKCVDAVGA